MVVFRVPAHALRLLYLPSLGPSPAPTTPPTTPPTAPPGLHDAHGAGGFWFLVLLFGLLLMGSYLVSIRRHPYRTCRRCKGTGKKHSTHFNNAFRACDACGGTARQHRPGATGPYQRRPRR
ncbi:hypothetical protein [Actinomadura rupiterrae]|uniref:hypothetical protein n=1 Tax=Actinomadura rupiterrae TaxID=559627 RepID=UPI0020A2FB02|nr:hypothetical protein [Actinomadura rupiterrae]MCP2337881.1 hypothetical protein [Actinomadura rupiterrae]